MNGYQVGPETFLTLRSTVFDAEGEVASEPEILGVVFGFGQLLHEIERRLEGKTEGDKVEVRLKSSQAFGKRDNARVLEVDRLDFPPDVTEGDRFEVENEQGGLLVVQVLHVTDDLVVLDTNHPLADQDVAFFLEILEVRPATSEEIVAAEEMMSEDMKYLADAAPDVSPRSLLRRPAPS